jgi:hypothetical protein
MKKKTVGGYPSPLASPEEKNSKEYILQYLKQMYADYTTKNKSLYNYQKGQMKINRLYAKGNQSSKKYKDLLDAEGDQSFLNLDWTPISIIPKFLDVLVGGMINQEFKPICTAIDAHSTTKRASTKAQMQTDMKMAPVNEKLKMMGIDMTQGREVQDTIEDIDLYMDLKYKQAAEVAFELALTHIYNINDFDMVQEMLIEDLASIGIAATKSEIQRNGKVVPKYVDPSRLVLSHSNHPDFRDCVHYGEVMSMSIRELKRVSGGQFTDDDLEKIAALVKSSPRNLTIENEDEFTVDVLDAEFEATDTYKFEKKKNRYGGYSFHKKDFAYEAPKNTRLPREQKNLEVKNFYVGKFIIGTDFIFDFGRKKNIERPKGMLSEAISSYQIYAPNMRNMKFKSIIERMIPFADQIQLTHLKLQQLIAKARPKGLAIEIGGLENVTKGDGGAVWDPLELQAVYDQTGNFYYRSTGDDGNPNGRPPIIELENGIGKDLSSLIGIYNYNLERIRDVTGINEARDGTMPAGDALVGIQKLSIQSSNNATRNINNGYTSILRRTSRSVIRKVQDVIKYLGDYDIYDEALGTSAIQSFKEIDGLREIDLAINIEALPDDEAKAMLEGNIQQSLAQKELRIEDAMMIRGIKNIKLAGRMLISRRKKYQEDLSKQAQANAQANAQQQAQSTQVAAQMDAQKMQMQSQSDMQKLQAEYAEKEKFALAEHTRKMAEIKLTKEMEGRNRVEWERERTERKSVPTL